MNYFMKLLCCCLLLVAVESNAQLADKWTASFSNPDGPGSVEVNDAVSDSNGETYLLATVFNGSDYDVYLRNYDEDGNLDWSQSYSSSVGGSEDFGVALTVDNSGNLYALISINPDDAGTTTHNGYAVRKYNASGTLLNDIESTGMIGSVATDITFLDQSTDYVYISTYKAVAGEANNIFLVRRTTSLGFSASVEFGGTSDEVAGKVYAQGSGAYISYYTGSTVGYLGYAYTFTSSSSATAGSCWS